jgi:hypothetical protein
VRQQRDEVVPTYKVEGLGNVEIEEKCRGFGAMESSRKVADVEVVIVNAPLFDEGSLASGNDMVH